MQEYSKLQLLNPIIANSTNNNHNQWTAPHRKGKLFQDFTGPFDRFSVENIVTRSYHIRSYVILCRGPRVIPRTVAFAIFFYGAIL